MTLPRDRQALTGCPYCAAPLTFVGSLGVTDTEQAWDAQADRFDCETGHTVLVVNTERLWDPNPNPPGEGCTP